MIKVEIIHRKHTLEWIQSLCEQKAITGYTTLRVGYGYGPQCGEYRDEQLNADQYYTFMILPDETAHEMMGHLKQRLRQSDGFIFYSSVSVY